MAKNSGALINANIITVNKKKEILKNHGIIWEKGRITNIGPSQEILTKADLLNIKVENLKQKFIFPGLVNTHAHLFQNLLKGTGTDMALEDWWNSTIGPNAINLREEHVRASTSGGALEAIRCGTTTIVDYMYPHPVPGLSDVVIETLQEVGIRTVFGRGSINKSILGVPEKLVESIDATLEDIIRIKGKYEARSDSMVKIMAAPAVNWTIDPRDLSKLSDFVKKTRTPITMHMFETKTDNDIWFDLYKCDFLEYIEEVGLLSPEMLAVHCVQVGDREIKKFKECDVKISHNAVSNMFLSSGIAPVLKMIENGLTVGLATDGAASNNSLDMIETMKVTALLQKVASLDPVSITAEDILEMATIKGARCLGMEEEIGSIEVGKRADFFVFDPDRHVKSSPCHDPIATLVYSSNYDAVEKVVINGKIILNDGRFVSLDEEYVLKQQLKMAKDILGH